MMFCKWRINREKAEKKEEVRGLIGAIRIKTEVIRQMHPAGTIQKGRQDNMPFQLR